MNIDRDKFVIVFHNSLGRDIHVQHVDNETRFVFRVRNRPASRRDAAVGLESLKVEPGDSELVPHPDCPYLIAQLESLGGEANVNYQFVNDGLEEGFACDLIWLPDEPALIFDIRPEPSETEEP